MDERPGEPGIESIDREILLGWLAFHRGALEAKCAGLTAEQLLTRSVPPSPMSLLGLVRHLSEMERAYLNQPLRGLAVELLYCTDEDEDGDFESASAETAERDLAHWREECALSDELISTFELDAIRPGGRSSVRWLVQKVVGEYARHNGHADLIREAIDGSTGE
jgi:hypothetical protein